MESYIQVSFLAMTCYCDALIADPDKQELFFASLFGRPGLVNAIGAAILESRPVHFGQMPLRRIHGWPYRTITQSLGGGVTHKVLLCEEFFTGSSARVIVGEDRQRAFEFLDSIVSTPLKEEWADLLWNRVFEPKQLFGFGSIQGRELSPVYLISLDKTVDQVDSLVLEGIRAGELN